MFNLLEHGATVATDENVAIIREIQRDPVTRQILHVDFYRIRMDVENDFEVPVHTIGIPAGVREGGILETLRHMIEICCLPTLLPKSIDIDVTGMKINQSFHARDLTLPEGVALVTDSEEVIFNILPPKEQVVVAPVEGEEVAQPEVITKKKEEGDGEAEKE
jgi:large subunit ribosomal protein L25